MLPFVYTCPDCPRLHAWDTEPELDTHLREVHRDRWTDEQIAEECRIQREMAAQVASWGERRPARGRQT